MKSLFCFGLGYSATALAARLALRGWTIGATTTSPAGAARIATLGYAPFLLDPTAGPTPSLGATLAQATHALVSAPPQVDGDPTLTTFADLIASSPALDWIGYLSTIGVYGDWNGDWIDEEAPLRPTSDRSIRRAKAEQAWLDLGAATGKRVVIFRLAGIYGPGRSAVDNILDGSARRIIKQGQIFNRIHRDDIAGVLEAAIDRTPRHTIYNITDDLPAPPQDVITYAADLLGRAPPPAIPFAEANLSPMGASFYAENKRVSNARAKGDLRWRLTYPTYREGLEAIVRDVPERSR
jgi:nucleoside-diphosphate-sugar epimerase